jgi:hypothetical protein
VLAPIQLGMEIIENGSYYRLLLMYKGLESPDVLLKDAAAGVERATIGYGVGNWYLYNGERERAVTVFKDVVSGGQPASFGAIAAEAELAKLRARAPGVGRGR